MIPLSVLAISMMASSLLGQDSAATLTLAEAITLAQRNNPDFLQTVNTRRTAAAAQRSAFGALLPQLNTSASTQYQHAGQLFSTSPTVPTSPGSNVAQSAYTLGARYQLTTGVLVGPQLQRANRAAVESDIAGARENLRAAVAQQYLTVLQSQARVILQDSLVANARVQVELARARAQVGSGTALDVQRAEVALGQQQVQQLRARNQLDVDRLRLFQQMGLPPTTSVTLTTTFTIDSTLPPLPTLLEMAHRENPGVTALRSRERVAALGVTQQRGAYLPTLSLSADVSRYRYDYRDTDLLLHQSPRSVSAQLSLPIFDGFVREQRVQEAIVQREDARYARRARELSLQADVTAAYLTLQTALQTVALQTQNAAKARQELSFVQDQYSVGLATFVDLTTARATYEQAENDRITAVYDYHKAFAALESAVGHPLR